MTARIIPKTGWFWSGLHWIVLVLTLGRNRRFLTDYATTIGPWIALPPDWVAHVSDPAPEWAWLRYLLVHERVHVEQFRRWGFGSPRVGIVTMGFAYLFLPLPVGLAWFRWRFEREAYAEGFRVELAQLPVELGRDATEWERHTMRVRLLDFAVEQLTTGAYAWTWPFPRTVRRWFEEHV